MKSACLIPCYNEASRLDTSEYATMFEAAANVDFYLLNDGSTDETLAILNGLADDFEHVFVVDSQPNQGKAGVIRKGFLECQHKDYEFIGFLDADLATPFSEFQRLLNIARETDYDIIVGSRVKLKGWKIERNAIRHWFSRIVLTVVDTLFRLEIYDTQCGCKLYRRHIVSQGFSEPFVTKWLFDIEVFIRCMRGVSNLRIKEIPLFEWKEVKGSKIKLTDFLSVPLNIFQLYRHYGRTKR